MRFQPFCSKIYYFSHTFQSAVSLELETFQCVSGQGLQLQLTLLSVTLYCDPIKMKTAIHECTLNNSLKQGIQIYSETKKFCLKNWVKWQYNIIISLYNDVLPPLSQILLYRNCFISHPSTVQSQFIQSQLLKASRLENYSTDRALCTGYFYAMLVLTETVNFWWG